MSTFTVYPNSITKTVLMKTLNNRGPTLGVFNVRLKKHMFIKGCFKNTSILSTSFNDG